MRTERASSVLCLCAKDFLLHLVKAVVGNVQGAGHLLKVMVRGGVRVMMFPIDPGKLTSVDSFVGCIGHLNEADIRRALVVIRQTLEEMGVRIPVPAVARQLISQGAKLAARPYATEYPVTRKGSNFEGRTRGCVWKARSR